MAYSELSPEDQIILAIDFIGMGMSIPEELSTEIPKEVLLDIQNPENTNDNQEHNCTSNRAG